MSHKIIQNQQKAIEVLHNVGSWMFANNLSTSDWWNPNNMNTEFFSKHSEPEEFYCLLIDGKPAAAVILQDNERNMSWEQIDGKDTQQALYVHWLCVHRDFAGQNLSIEMLKFAEQKARELGFNRLRLDTSAENDKLVSLYKNYGFNIRGIKPYDEDHDVVFFEKILD